MNKVIASMLAAAFLMTGSAMAASKASPSPKPAVHSVKPTPTAKPSPKATKKPKLQKTSAKKPVVKPTAKPKPKATKKPKK